MDQNPKLSRANAGAAAPLDFRPQPHKNGSVIELTEPQVWVLIGVFAAAIFSMIGIVSTGFNRTMGARFETMDARFDAMDARFDAMRTEMNAKFDVINVKLENMDRDIQALSRHSFGTDPR